MWPCHNISQLNCLNFDIEESSANDASAVIDLHMYIIYVCVYKNYIAYRICVCKYIYNTNMKSVKNRVVAMPQHQPTHVFESCDEEIRFL